VILLKIHVGAVVQWGLVGGGTMRRAAAGLPWGACMLGTLLLVQLAVVANGFLAPLPAQGARMRIAAVRRPLVCMSQGEPEEVRETAYCLVCLCAWVTQDLNDHHCSCDLAAL
jgi:hypothetical protein